MYKEPDRCSIGVSSCLLGNQVRYDGGHKHDHYLSGQLSRFFTFVPVCPEVDSGMPVPRDAMRLVDRDGSLRLITIKQQHDLTAQMTCWVDQCLPNLEQYNLRGFILKKNSPSCGMYRVKIYQEKGPPRTTGQGIFAAALSARYPLLPIEEEGRLCDASLRENFIERIYAYDRLLTLIKSRPSRGDLVKFHTEHKLLLMAHSNQHYRQLGSMVAQATELEQTLQHYTRLFMDAFRLLATPAKQTNVLMHCAGYFKKQLDGWEKQELLEIIERYRTGKLPLIVPITMLKHYVTKYNQSYLAGQDYFSPHPDELMLRNHA